jgi:AraC-like DNA-binding protein
MSGIDPIRRFFCWMTRYISSGLRNLGQAPILPHSRLNWEFIAVTKGRCGVILASGEKLPLREQSLWIFPPGFVHGWHGERGASSMLTFQVDEVPIEISVLMRGADFLEYELLPSEFEEVSSFRTVIHPDFSDRDPVIVVRGLTANGGGIADIRVTQTVNKAIEWLKCHLTEQPSVRDMAAAAGVSSSYLRRFFKSKLNRQPHQVMMDVKMDVAAELLATTGLNQDAIAASAGFASVRAFTRAFSSRKRCSPGAWRQKARAGEAPSGPDDSTCFNISGGDDRQRGHRQMPQVVSGVAA